MYVRLLYIFDCNCAIRYATVSKRVNIQRLKADIWSNIEQNLPINTEEQSERAVKQSTTTSTKDALSFQDMISDIAANPRQKDVTLPFYFICLLHLANENVSRLLLHCT